MYHSPPTARAAALIFQEVDHFPNEALGARGYAKTFESILKAYPRTTFIGPRGCLLRPGGAGYQNEAAYPTGPIKRGGVTDKLLATTPIFSAICPPTQAQRHVTRCRVHGRFPETPSGQAAVRQRLRLR